MDMEGGMRVQTKTMMVAIALAVVVVLAALTFVIPDRYGELREDLVVGDYIVYKSDSYIESLEILEIADDGTLTVRHYAGKETNIYQMSQETFLSKIKFDKRDHPGTQYVCLASLKSPVGNKLCSMYNYMLNNYLVDEYGVIYFQSLGGVYWTLVDTSLLYGITWPLQYKDSSMTAEEASG